MHILIPFFPDPLGKISPPLPKCASIPPLFTRPPTGLRNDISTSSPSDGVKGKTGMILSALSYILAPTLLAVVREGSLLNKNQKCGD